MVGGRYFQLRELPHMHCRIVVILALLLATGGCSHAELSDRTYPPALDLEQIDLESLKSDAPLPSAYNVRGFVVQRNMCPPDARCAIPDGVIIAESLSHRLPEEGLHLTIDDPYQFTIGSLYMLSIEVAPAGWTHPDSGKPVRRMALLGYSRTN